MLLDCARARDRRSDFRATGCTWAMYLASILQSGTVIARIRMRRASAYRYRRREPGRSIMWRSMQWIWANVKARLSAHGVTYSVNDVPAAGLTQLFLNDPNGVKVEINVR